MPAVKAVFDLIHQRGCIPVEVIETYINLEYLLAVAYFR